MGVSSRESWAYRLTDGTGSYWQSCGTQGNHFYMLVISEFVKNVKIVFRSFNDVEFIFIYI
jgi:hypothetical protein